MSFKLQTTMASGLRDETKPRRFDLTMSRRTRRAAAATSATDRHQQDHHQAVDVEGLGFQPVVVVQPERQDPYGLFCLSDHLQSRQPELDAHQEHETLEQRSQDTNQEQTCRRLEKKDDVSEAQHQEEEEEEEEEECQGNSRSFSLQELIEDEGVVDDGVKNAVTGGTEENAAAREVAEGAAAEGETKRPGQQVPGRRVIGMMRRYVKVRSIKPKRASPEKNAALVW